jgi:hypothetical protein
MIKTAARSGKPFETLRRLSFSNSGTIRIRLIDDLPSNGACSIMNLVNPMTRIQTVPSFPSGYLIHKPCPRPSWNMGHKGRVRIFQYQDEVSVAQTIGAPGDGSGSAAVVSAPIISYGSPYQIAGHNVPLAARHQPTNQPSGESHPKISCFDAFPQIVGHVPLSLPPMRLNDSRSLQGPASK